MLIYFYPSFRWLETLSDKTRGIIETGGTGDFEWESLKNKNNQEISSLEGSKGPLRFDHIKILITITNDVNKIVSAKWDQRNKMVRIKA